MVMLNVDANNKKAAIPMQVAMSVANRQKAIRTRTSAHNIINVNSK